MTRFRLHIMIQNWKSLQAIMQALSDVSVWIVTFSNTFSITLQQELENTWGPHWNKGWSCLYMITHTLLFIYIFQTFHPAGEILTLCLAIIQWLSFSRLFFYIFFSFSKRTKKKLQPKSLEWKIPHIFMFYLSSVPLLNVGYIVKISQWNWWLKKCQVKENWFYDQTFL